MKRFIITTLAFITYFVSYGQVKVNPIGKFFDYNGIQIYYEDSGTGEPLLLLHKFFGTADNWKPYVETYSKYFRTIAVDMMGHGRSNIYNENDLNFKHEEYAKMIIALLDYLKLKKVSAIGASAGGLTLHYLNVLQPDRFKSVITIGAHIYFSTESRENITRTGIEIFMNAAKNHGPEKQAYLAKAFWEFRKLSNSDPSFTPDQLNTFKANWLVVLGDNDPHVPLQLGIEMHQGIPNSRFWVVPNGGHTPHLNDGFQAEFKRISLEFLTEKWNTKN